MARRGWLEKKDVINTLPAAEFLAALRPKPGTARPGGQKRRAAKGTWGFLGFAGALPMGEPFIPLSRFFGIETHPPRVLGTCPPSPPPAPFPAPVSFPPPPTPL